jgi:hypothetical protein
MEMDRYFKTSWMSQLLADLQADDALELHEKLQRLCDVFKDKAKKPAIVCTSLMSLWLLLLLIVMACTLVTRNGCFN